MERATTARVVLVAALLMLPRASLPAASAPAQETALAAGMRQVEEGDFEGAIATLEPLVERLAASGGPHAAQACVQLAIAHLALDHRDAARFRFRQALDHQRGLRLSPDRYSPKVLGAFEEARKERDAALRSAPSVSRQGHRGRTLLLTGGGVAAGVGIAILAGRGADATSGTLSFAAARFAPPAVDCADGVMGVPLTVGIDLEATHDGEGSVRVTSVSSVLIIVSSPAAPQEVNTAESAATNVTPSSVGRGTTTLHVRTTLTCYNGAGDEPRFNDWLGRVTLVTASGAVTLETSDRLRVNIP